MADWDQAAVLCGACGVEMSVREYLACANRCPTCGAPFNPGLRKPPSPLFRGRGRGGMKTLALVALIGLIAGGSCTPRPSADKAAAPRGVLYDAFAVAFGKPAPYATVDESGDHVVYNPQASST